MSWERERVSNTTFRSSGAVGEGWLLQDISPVGRLGCFLKINIVFWGNFEVIAWLIFASARLIIYTSGPGLYRARPTASVWRFYTAGAAAAPLLAFAEVTARIQHHILGEKFPQ